MDKSPKILFLDIETLPNLGWTWQKYDQNVLDFERQACLASVAFKWKGRGEEVGCYALPDYSGYTGGSYNDAGLVLDAWKLLDAADILVTHNGDAFDLKMLTGRFIVHGLRPPSPYKSVDTKLLARKVARYNSNKLDDLSSLFGHGRKLHTDFSLWQGCIAGDLKAWRRMVRYNKYDVRLLEKLYNRLLPWCSNHPNQGLWDAKAVCPKCGGRNVQMRGTQVCVSRTYQRFQCKTCGGWGRLTKSTGAIPYVNAA